jgi:hypothetical protein
VRQKEQIFNIEFYCTDYITKNSEFLLKLLFLKYDAVYLSRYFFLKCQ